MPLIAADDAGMKNKLIAAVVMVLMFITIWFMLDMVLLIFIISFIFYACLSLVKRLLMKTPLARVPDGILLLLVFILGLGIVAIASVAFVPILIEQGQDIARAFIGFNWEQFQESLDTRLQFLVKDLDIGSYINSIGIQLLGYIVNIGSFGINFVMALAVSFILLLEKSKISRFGKVLESSRLSYIYKYLMVFGVNFCRTFGKVMKVQVTIAFINALVSVAILAVLGFKSYVWGLGVMIFLLGLVPVAGVIISFIPLGIIAFNLGGVTKVVQIVIMVCVVHAIEAYILNPKLMSHHINLPVSFVFIILLVAEQYLGTWGLLIGVPIFVFLLSLFDVDYESAWSVEKDLRKKKKLDRDAKVYYRKKL